MDMSIDVTEHLHNPGAFFLSDSGGKIIAEDLDEAEALEIARRVNAFEPGGLVVEMAEALGKVLPLDHYQTCAAHNRIRRAQEERDAACTCGAVTARATLAKFKGEEK